MKEKVTTKRVKKLTAEAIRRKTLAKGALHAKFVSPEKVFTAAWVRWKCQYGCGGYGSSLLCPPWSPTPEATRRMLDGYGRGILIHADRTTDVRRIVADLEREAFLGGFYKAFGFACGPCRLCDECEFEDSCRHPDRARPAMEACGIDVYRTARAAGLPIEVAADHDCRTDYYGLLLLE